PPLLLARDEYQADDRGQRKRFERTEGSPGGLINGGQMEPLQSLADEGGRDKDKKAGENRKGAEHHPASRGWLQIHEDGEIPGERETHPRRHPDGREGGRLPD